MPTNQPSSAPDSVEPRDADTAATVLNDATLDTTPGLGGLGGASAADPLSGSQRTPAGNAPNSPIDLGIAAPDDDLAGNRDAKHEAAERDAPEPRPVSR